MTSFISPPTPSAQLTPDIYAIFQNGNEVGNIFVPNRDPEACTYMESWYLFESYEYPGQENPVSTTLEHADLEFSTLQEIRPQYRSRVSYLLDNGRSPSNNNDTWKYTSTNRQRV